MQLNTSNKYPKNLAIFLLGMLLLSLMAFQIWSGDASASAVGETSFEESKSMVIKQGTPHAPIHINGNADFENQAANENWTGNGTEGNPYIIEGYEIDGNGGSYCIWIENTNVYFVIRNCLIFNATDSQNLPYGAGIALQLVQNGIITNNTASGNRYGIYLNSCTYTTIGDNNATSNSQYGICLYASNSNSIINNTASNNSRDGIYLGMSSYNNIRSNNLWANSEYGLRLGGATYNNIINNTLWSNHFGIYLFSSSNNNTITDNNASDNSYYGLYLDSSEHNTIARNLLYSNLQGITLWSSGNNLITNNTARSNSYGIYLYSSSNNNITYNWFFENTNYGIYILGSSSANTIHHNMFIANNGASKGCADGKSQAYDDSGGNYWFDAIAKEGNYWSNWDGNGWGTASAYPIDGSAGASDIYPWGGPTNEFSALPLAILGQSLCLGFAMLRRRK